MAFRFVAAAHTLVGRRCAVVVSPRVFTKPLPSLTFQCDFSQRFMSTEFTDDKVTNDEITDDEMDEDAPPTLREMIQSAFIEQNLPLPDWADLPKLNEDSYNVAREEYDEIDAEIDRWAADISDDDEEVEEEEKEETVGSLCISYSSKLPV
jgi:hypothetical protein